MRATTDAPGAAVDRVSMREVRENAFRALVATGASAGEATAAATTVLEAEIHGWDGLGALLTAVDGRTVGGARSTRLRERPDGVPVVEAPAGTEPLLLGRTVLDVIAARTTPLLVCGLEFHEILRCHAVELAERTGRTTVFVAVTGECALACGADGDLRMSSEPDPDVLPVDLTGCAGGVCVAEPAAHRAPDWPVVSTPDERTDHRAAARRHGLRVSRGRWTAVRDAARQFLVRESAGTPTE